MTDEKKTPHIQTKELAATLRECAKLLTRAVPKAGAEALPEIMEAISTAVRQADALDGIKKPRHVIVLGTVPFSVKGVPFEIAEGVSVPVAIFAEESGESFGLGFYNADAAMHASAAIGALAIMGEFPDTGTAH